MKATLDPRMVAASNAEVCAASWGVAAASTPASHGAVMAELTMR